MLLKRELTPEELKNNKRSPAVERIRKSILNFFSGRVLTKKATTTHRVAQVLTTDARDPASKEEERENH